MEKYLEVLCMLNGGAVELFAGTVGIEKEMLFDELKKQRENKEYLLNPVSIKVEGTGIIDNSSVIAEGVSLMRKRADEVIKNELDVENVELVVKEFGEIHKWLTATRTSVTKEFDETKKKFTANEKRLKDEIIGDLNSHILTMKERVFVVAENNIKKELQILLDENSDLGIGLDVFESFIAEKRKTAGMLPSEKTQKTSASALRTIKDEFEKIAKPIKEAQALDKQKTLQSKQFEHYLDGISIDGEDMVIEAGIKSLYQLEASVDESFPDIIDACKRSIKNKIEKAETNIKTNKLMKERDEALGKANANAVHDEPFMEQVAALNDGVMFDEVETLEEKLTKLRGIHPQVKEDKNKEKIVEIANSIKELISQAQAKEIKQDVKPKKSFGISDVAIKKIAFELQMIDVEAEDVVDARGKMIAEFAEAFSVDFIEEL